MVESINIQLTCHASHIGGKNIQFRSITSPVYHHLFVSCNTRGLRGHNDELLTLGWREETRSGGKQRKSTKEIFRTSPPTNCSEGNRDRISTQLISK